MSKGFRGMPGGGNIQGLFQQAQKMKEQIERAQAEVESFQADGSAGGGVVQAKVNGKYELVSLAINPQAVSEGDVELLQDMIVAAVNDAVTKVRKHTETHMSQATGGMNIPGLT